MRDPVDLQIGNLNGIGAIHRSAPEQRFDPHDQFCEGEGLREIIIRTRLEIRHLVREGIPRRQHHDGYIGILPAHAADEFRAAQYGQPQVDDEQIVGRERRHLQARLPVAGTVDGKPLGLQADGNKAGQLFFVFNKKDTHR
jgi:hypothetical protein